MAAEGALEAGERAAAEQVARAEAARRAAEEEAERVVTEIRVAREAFEAEAAARVRSFSLPCTRKYSTRVDKTAHNKMSFWETKRDQVYSRIREASSMLVMFSPSEAVFAQVAAAEAALEHLEEATAKQVAPTS